MQASHSALLKIAAVICLLECADLFLEEMLYRPALFMRRCPAACPCCRLHTWYFVRGQGRIILLIGEETVSVICRDLLVGKFS